METRVRLKFSSATRSIFHDSKGNYWFGSHREGVALFDGESYTYFSTADGLPNNDVRTIDEDEKGTIWFGTAGGVAYYDGERVIALAPSPEDSLGGRWSKKKGDLWFGAGNKPGVYRYDGKGVDYLAFPKPKVINPDNTYHSTGFSKGKEGVLWMATYAGVFGYDGANFTIINDETLGLVNKTGVLHVRNILSDSKGDLWIGNNGIGVLHVSGDTTSQFSKEMGLVSEQSQRMGGPSPQGTLEHVFSIGEDQYGNIWFGNRDTGAWKYDGKVMTNYSLPDKILSPFIRDIYLDRKGQLLFALEGGVYKFDGQSFQEFPKYVGPPLVEDE